MMAVFDVPLIVYVQDGELAEPLMQASQVPSPSEEAGYASPDARQDSRTYIPPGFTVERSGNAMFLLVKQSMPKQHLLECCTGMLHRNAAQECCTETSLVPSHCCTTNHICLQL